MSTWLQAGLKAEEGRSAVLLDQASLPKPDATNTALGAVSRVMRPQICDISRSMRVREIGLPRGRERVIDPSFFPSVAAGERERERARICVPGALEAALGHSGTALFIPSGSLRSPTWGRS